MNKKIITIGSLTSDTFLHPRRQEIFQKDEKEFIGFCLGDKIRVREKKETFGGGGANVAIGLSRLGLDTAVIGKIGDDTHGKQILKNLQSEHVSNKHIQKEKNSHSGFSIILSAHSGERTVLFSSGANDSFSQIDTGILEEYDGVCLQHLSGGSQSIFDSIYKHFSKHQKKFLSWNPGREALEKGAHSFTGILSVLNLLLINREEGELFTQEKDIKNIFRSLHDAGMKGNIIITDGMKGATGFDGKSIYFCPVLEGHKRVDTLGAGDSFLTGSVGGIFHGKSLPEALKLGTINAAHVVSYFGAQFGLQSQEILEKHTHKINVCTSSFSLFKNKYGKHE
jgi:ribokinase